MRASEAHRVEPSSLESPLGPSSWSDEEAADDAPAWPPPGFLDNRAAALVAQLAVAFHPMFYLGIFGLSIADAIVAELTGEPWALGTLLLSVADPAEIMVRVVTAAAFITWLHRVSKNTHLLSAVRPEQAPANAIVAWFVPFANLVWPYQIVSEIDRKNAPAGKGTTSALIGAWWGAWIASLLLGQIMSHARGNAAGPATVMFVASQLAAAALAILVIRRVQRNQIALATRSEARAVAAHFV